MTVAEFLDREWLPAVEATVRPLSVEKYRQAVRLYSSRKSARTACRASRRRI
jgi:hypothetical protein